MIRLLKKICGSRSSVGTLCTLSESHDGFYHSDDDGRIWS